jgi:hypothetical protein
MAKGLAKTGAVNPIHLGIKGEGEKEGRFGLPAPANDPVDPVGEEKIAEERVAKRREIIFEAPDPAWKKAKELLQVGERKNPLEDQRGIKNENQIKHRGVF